VTQSISSSLNPLLIASTSLSLNLYIRPPFHPLLSIQSQTKRQSITSHITISSCLPTGPSTSASSVIARPPAVPTAHRPAGSPSWIAHRPRTSNPHLSPRRTLDPPLSTPLIPDRHAVCPPHHRRPHCLHCGVMPPMPPSPASFKMNCGTMPAASITSEISSDE
jgi:hypothetical protein